MGINKPNVITKFTTLFKNLQYSGLNMKQLISLVFALSSLIVTVIIAGQITRLYSGARDSQGPNNPYPVTFTIKVDPIKKTSELSARVTSFTKSIDISPTEDKRADYSLDFLDSNSQVLFSFPVQSTITLSSSNHRTTSKATSTPILQEEVAQSAMTTSYVQAAYSPTIRKIVLNKRSNNTKISEINSSTIDSAVSNALAVYAETTQTKTSKVATDDGFYDLLVISEDYTQNQINLFHENANYLFNFMKGEEPFNQYTNKIRLFKVENFENICEPGNPGMGGCDTDLFVQIANDSGYPYDTIWILQHDPVAIYSGGHAMHGFAFYMRNRSNSQSDPYTITKEIFLHELGHALGWLFDEYITGSCLLYNANCDQYQCYKWNSLSGTGCYSNGSGDFSSKRVSEPSIMREVAPGINGLRYDINAKYVMLKELASHFSCPPTVTTQNGKLIKKYPDYTTANGIDIPALLEWSACDNASHYKIQISGGGNSWTSPNIYNTEYDLRSGLSFNLQPAVLYTWKAKGCINGNCSTSPWSSNSTFYYENTNTTLACPNGYACGLVRKQLPNGNIVPLTNPNGSQYTINTYSANGSNFASTTSDNIYGHYRIPDLPNNPFPWFVRVCYQDQEDGTSWAGSLSVNKLGPASTFFVKHQTCPSIPGGASPTPYVTNTPTPQPTIGGPTPTPGGQIDCNVSGVNGIVLNSASSANCNYACSLCGYSGCVSVGTNSQADNNSRKYHASSTQCLDELASCDTTMPYEFHFCSAKKSKWTYCNCQQQQQR